MQSPDLLLECFIDLWLHFTCVSSCGVTQAGMERERNVRLEERSFVPMTQCCCVNGSANAHLEANCWTCCPEHRHGGGINGKQSYRARTRTHIKPSSSEWDHKLNSTSTEISSSFKGFAKGAEEDRFKACYWTVSVASCGHRIHAAAL